MHHIISDGWSMNIFLRDFTTIYSNLINKIIPIDNNLPKLIIQYVDYAQWQKKYLKEKGIIEKQLEFWKNYLSGKYIEKIF